MMGATKIKVAAVLLIFCAGILGHLESQRASAQRSDPDSYAAFPLWKDVPGKTFAGLREGRLLNGTRWAAFISKARPVKRAKANPCVTIAKITRFGEYGHATDCGSPTSDRNTGRPIFVEMSASYRAASGTRVVGETVMAFLFSSDIVKLEAQLSSGGSIVTHTQPLKLWQQTKAHLTALRYVALGMLRDVCIRSIAGYDISGSRLVDRETEICP
jgi:hypothetical protein